MGMELPSGSYERNVEAVDCESGLMFLPVNRVGSSIG
jgi:hypothetical protein